MAVIFDTGDPAALLQNFKDAIDEENIETWQYDDDGDFYHTDEQFVGQAWFRAEIENNQLVFYIVRSKEVHVSEFVYAYYHGHLVQAFLYHFDHDFTSATATALAADGDST